MALRSLTAPTGGKRIDTAQLATELAALGVTVARTPLPDGGTVPRMAVAGGTVEVGAVDPPEDGEARLARAVAAHAAPAPRRRRAVAAIRDDILALTAAQRNRLFATAVAWLAVEHPGLLARLEAAIPEDEPDV